MAFSRQVVSTPDINPWNKYLSPKCHLLCFFLYFYVKFKSKNLVQEFFLYFILFYFIFSNHYLDLADSLLRIKLKVVNTDGTNLAEGSTVGTTNLFMHALFSQLDLYFNEQLVSNSNIGYSYRAYMETLLCYGNEHKSLQGECGLYY